MKINLYERRGDERIGNSLEQSNLPKCVGECPLDGHASLMIDILTVYIFSISTYTMLKTKCS